MNKKEFEALRTKPIKEPLWVTDGEEKERLRIKQWAEWLDQDAAKYAGGGADMDIPETDDGFGPNDDSEEFRWEHEYKLKIESCASHVYVPTNFSDCYESEIMGRANGWVESAGV